MHLENIVIYRLGSLGDTIVALPCFHKIAQCFPSAKRILLTNIPVSTKAAPLEAILGSSGLIDRAIAYPVGTRSLIKLWGISREIRALKPTTLIYLMPARGRVAAFRDFIFFRLSGVRRIIGLPLSSDLQNSRVDAATGDLEPECERLARTLAELGPIDLSAPAAWDLVLTKQEELAGRRCVDQFGGSPFIAINMGGKAVEKDWGAARWTELLTEISKTRFGYGLLILGAAEDSERARAVSGNWPSRVFDACGRLGPRESAAALRSASLFIGHDSGPLHLAAAVDVPCVGLYGGLNRPKKWHPHAKTKRIIHRMEGISAITVDEVAEAVSGLLPTTSPRPGNNGWSP